MSVSIPEPESAPEAAEEVHNIDVSKTDDNLGFNTNLISSISEPVEPSGSADTPAATEDGTTPAANLTNTGFPSSANIEIPNYSGPSETSEGLPQIEGFTSPFEPSISNSEPEAVNPNMNQNIFASDSQDIQTEDASQENWAPESTHMNSGIENDSEEIHFGSIIPDEMIDPNAKQPIDDVLKAMIENNASDLHLTQNQPICFRVDGEIIRVNEELIDASLMENLILPIMPPKNRREFVKYNDTDFAYEIPNLARFRVNVFRDLQGVGAVLRQIPNEVLTAEQLGLPPAIRKFCQLHKGLVLVTGPTGSGKSTTLAAMIDLINSSRKEHILTIEDPVEFVHKQKSCLINQREVYKHTNSFSRALKAALREDPDIILIGEMRDLETVAIAIETAETGHLVFGTLHTNTAISTVDRLVDQFPADQQPQIRVMLAESLKGVVSQTLVKKKNGGRAAAHEILVVDRAVSSILREGNTHMIANQMQTQKSQGNIMLNDSLVKLVVDGTVTVEDAWAKAIDKPAFEALAQSRGVPFKKAV